MNAVSISFEVEDKMITLKREIESGEEIHKTVTILLKECEEIVKSGKVRSAQFRALYARAFAAGWEKEKVKELLENRLGTSSRDDIVGVMEKQVLSRLIDEIGAPVQIPGKASIGQMKALWAKALNKGWDRERIRGFLKDKLGVSRDDQIVGHLDKKLISEIIDQLAAA